MTVFNTIVRQLEQLRLYLDRLAELQQYSREALLGDWVCRRWWSVRCSWRSKP